MCGPLILAVPTAQGRGVSSGRRWLSVWSGRLAYNGGRLLSYAVLGLAFGLIGRSLAMIGLQRWTSLVAGSLILLTLVGSGRWRFAPSLARVITSLKGTWVGLLKHRTIASLFLLGILNGFLPCGLVYVACTSAITLGGCISAAGYMVIFGLGTVPMMLGIALAGSRLSFAARLRFQKLVPICVGLLGTILILRGV